MRVKILHCADLHIGAAGASLGEKSESRRSEALINFENIINIAREQKTDFLLIAGDLLGSNYIEESFVRRIVDCISSVPETAVIFAAGNHDPKNADSPFSALKLPENFFILPEKDGVISFPEKNTKIYGRSFCEVYLAGQERFSLPADESTINIMCQHGDLRADLSSDYNSITPGFIENSGMDYIALGHIHKRSEVQKRGNTYFAYSGCAEGLGFDELGEKGVYIGEVGKNFADLKFLRTCIRTNESVTVDVSDCGDSAAAAEKALAAIAEEYGENYGKNLYKVCLSGSVADGVWFDTKEIAARLLQKVFFARVKDKTKIAKDLDVIKNENSLKGIFVSKMLALAEEKPEEKDKLLSALSLGLKAFGAEVDYGEN